MTSLRPLAIGLMALVVLATGCGNKTSQATTSAGTTSTPVETTVTQTQTETETQTVTVEVGPPTVTTGGAENALPSDANVLPPGGSLAASGLRAATHCREGKGVARLRWSPSAEPGESQRVAVTIFPEERDPRKFELVQQVSPSARSLVWAGLSGQAIHTWIVLTRHQTGWAPSARATFTGPPCAADFNSP